MHTDTYTHTHIDQFNSAVWDQCCYLIKFIDSILLPPNNYQQNLLLAKTGFSSIRFFHLDRLRATGSVQGELRNRLVVQYVLPYVSNSLLLAVL